MLKTEVLIDEIVTEADGVRRLVLRRKDDSFLKDFTPGAHIDLNLPSGLIRQYSLLNDGRAPKRYEVAVLRSPTSRGGSEYVHAQLHVGDVLDISEPRNNFPMRIGQEFFFIAGGIGITPIMSMIRYCNERNWNWRLLYLSRSRGSAAFHKELSAFGKDRVLFHFNDEENGLFDFSSAALNVPSGVPIYCCGPVSVMNAVADYSTRHPENRSYFEWFSPPSAVESAEPVAGFDITLHDSGKVFHVPKNKTILEVLENNGYEIPYSCREGMCRTCESKVIEGVVDHRDYVLSPQEREDGNTMMICVSRAKTPMLVLEI